MTNFQKDGFHGHVDRCFREEEESHGEKLMERRLLGHVKYHMQGVGVFRDTNEGP